MPAPTPQQIQYMERHIDESKVPMMIIVSAVCLPAAYIFVVLRFVSRHVGLVKLNLSDWLTLVALVSTL